MKNYFAITILLISLSVAAQSSFTSPDILIETKLDYDFSSVLLRKYRDLCKTYGIQDPLKGKLEKPLLLNQSRLESILPDSSNALLEDFGNAIGLNILQTETNVWVHDLSYDIREFKTNLKARAQELDGLVIGADFQAEEIRISAEKVSLSLIIPGKASAPVFNVDLIKPEIRARKDRLIRLKSVVKLKNNKDHFKVEIREANFDEMARALIENQQDIEFDFERISMPKLSLKIGNRTVSFSPEKIEALVRSYRPALKEILVAQASEILKSNTMESSLKFVERYEIKRNFWIPTPLFQTQFVLGNFSKATDDKNLQLSMPADFCTTENYNVNQENCIHKKLSFTTPSRLSFGQHVKSLATIREYFDRDEASIIASISEDYLNKLLVATYDAGLWDNALKSANVAVGKNMMKLVLNRYGTTGTFIMDVVYRPTNMERMITGSTEIRFPLAVDVSLHIEKKDEIPYVVVRLHDVDTSDQTIISGRDGFTSTVQDVSRFKLKVAKAIREKISMLANRDLVEFKYPELNGIGLEKVEFISDGNGRMNAIMRLEDLLPEKR